MSLYLIAATGTARFIPIRLLYDGEAPPPPYRWVNPPGNVPGPHEPPEPGVGAVALTASGSEAKTVFTPDLQASVLFRKDAVTPRSPETTVQVRLIPIDPETIAPVPPGARFDSNAYRIAALYENSRQPATLRAPVFLVMRYAVHASTLLWSPGTPTWTPIEASGIIAGQQLFAETDRLGIFVIVTFGR
ncbi:MAG: hypothetical protein ACRDFA_12285 [bacterium]